MLARGADASTQTSQPGSEMSGGQDALPSVESGSWQYRQELNVQYHSRGKLRVPQVMQWSGTC